MDIKDFILIGGGLLIAAVVAHGFWIAWRARRDPLRLDLVQTPVTAEEGDDLHRLRSELPNGGARVVSPRQEALALGEAGGEDAPVLLDPSDDDEASSSGRTRAAKTEPRLEAPSRSAARAQALSGRTVNGPDREPLIEPRERGEAETDTPARTESTTASGSGPVQAGSRRGKVADVILPERPIKADEPKEPRRWSARKASQDARATEPREPQADAHGSERAASRAARGGVQTGSGNRKAEPAVEELIMVNVLAPKGSPFVGGGLVEALRARGLRYGDMNIFHRVDPMTRANLYSVANVVEPGTFDMADLDNFRSPGVCFFMQLPGPEQPMEVLEDMLKVARDVAVRTGGSLFDEQRSVMTGQTMEHYRQRISDFCRRRMSMRA